MKFKHEDRWTRHFQQPWEDRSGDPRLPTWLRVVSYAYGKHKANGHAPLRPGSKHGLGTLKEALLTIDAGTGKITYPSRQVIHQAVNKAIDYGWLDAASSTRCLIVPRRAITDGLGFANAPCEACQPAKRRRRAA